MHVAASLIPLACASLAAAWSRDQFQHAVIFGDSYTDQGRLKALLDNGGANLPPGEPVPERFDNADGGRVWPQYLAQYTDNTLAVQNYAVSGASCSNLITPRYFAPQLPTFPSVREYQLPAFFNDSVPSGSADNTVYTIFIGTNDIGAGAFINDQQVRGKSLADYTDCVFEQVHALYDRGARYFVLFNLAALYKAPLYASAEAHGVRADPNFWPDKPSNLTEVSEKMRQYVSSLNQVYQYRSAFEAASAQGLQIALYDIESLFLDIYANPGAFLNGTATPYNTTDFETNHADLTSPDSFMWFDALHPSEQVERHIASTFLDILQGNSTYGSYFGTPC